MVLWPVRKAYSSVQGISASMRRFLELCDSGDLRDVVAVDDLATIFSGGREIVRHALMPSYDRYCPLYLWTLVCVPIDSDVVSWSVVFLTDADDVSLTDVDVRGLVKVPFLHGRCHQDNMVHGVCHCTGSCIERRIDIYTGGYWIHHKNDFPLIAELECDVPISVADISAS